MDKWSRALLASSLILLTAALLVTTQSDAMGHFSAQSLFMAGAIALTVFIWLAPKPKG